MWRKEEVREKPQCVLECEARITVEEAAMSVGEKEARYLRAVANLDRGNVFRKG